MTVASKGLQKALARAGSSVLAIAEMQVDDILANMSDEQKAELTASLTPAPAPAAKGDAEPDDTDPAETGEPDEKAKKKAEAEAEAAAANASERDRVKAVAKAVAEDEACKGKADVALAMLADDDYATLSASGIVKLVGKQAVSAGNDAEAAARAEMKAALDENGNSKIDAGGAGKKDKAESSASVWDAAIAKVAPTPAK